MAVKNGPFIGDFPNEFSFIGIFHCHVRVDLCSVGLSFVSEALKLVVAGVWKPLNCARHCLSFEPHNLQHCNNSDLMMMILIFSSCSL